MPKAAFRRIQFSMAFAAMLTLGIWFIVAPWSPRGQALGLLGEALELLLLFPIFFPVLLHTVLDLRGFAFWIAETAFYTAIFFQWATVAYAFLALRNRSVKSKG
jgi:hypothetical protein